MTSQRVFSCAAILFDLDGVLVDSTASVGRFWALWAAEHNVSPEEAVRVAHGRRTLETIRLLAPHLDAEAETVRLERREADDTDGVGRVHGALELLSTLPAQRWAVVTSGTRYLATRRLATNGLPAPAVFVTADEVTLGKPHPEPYLKGAELLGLSPLDCLVFEDAPAGIEAARAARMTAIGVATTYPAAELTLAHAVVRDLSQVRTRLDGDGRLEVMLG
ncbi:MAG TPA: HAD family hydrolase [Terriglobales bacterium]|jgi:sugar-phosphatase|nr:HAD family hydrolase [Terriglobales bacterium]